MIDSLNRKIMSISKKKSKEIRHAKCPNCHCSNFDSNSVSNCVLNIAEAMRCVYNEVSQYERK